MNEQERDAFLLRLLSDQELSNEMQEQENEWIDALAAGRLPPAEAARVREHLARTGQLDRLAVAAAMVRPAPRPAISLYGPAMAMAALVMIGFGVFFQYEKHRYKPTYEETAALADPQYLTPGTLRNAARVQQVTRRAGTITRLYLQYQDISPKGTCQVSLRQAEQLIDGPKTAGCGEEFHAYYLPKDLAPGRYTVELADGKGELLHTYVFDEVDEK